MMFQTIKDSLINNVLGPSAVDFVVVGYQRQSKNAVEVLDNLRTAQVFYSASEFKKSAGRFSGPVQNDITFRIELTVSKAAEGDLTVINNPSSTPGQISSAIAAFQEAAALADESFDALVNSVWNIIMDARNVDLGLEKADVTDRWIERVFKDQPLPQGDYVTITGGMELTCRTAEEPSGDTGTAGSYFDFTIDIDGDDVERTGVIVDNT